MAKRKNVEIPGTVISNWLSTRFPISYMGLWEKMNNPDFNLTGFREVKTLSAEPGFALSKINYRIHTNAIKERIIPQKVTRAQASLVCASEADLLNVALFGMTAAQWIWMQVSTATASFLL